MDRRLKKKLKQIEDLKHEASTIAVGLVIEEARRILNEDEGLFEFIMAMGSCFFTIKEGGKYDALAMSDEDAEEWFESDDYVREYKGMIDDDNFQKEFFDMVNDLDTEFNVCGYPVRFTANSEEVHNWGDTNKNPVIYVQKR